MFSFYFIARKKSKVNNAHQIFNWKVSFVLGMADKWYNEEDFKKDFWSMAEIKTSDGHSPPPLNISNNYFPQKTHFQTKFKSIYYDPELHGSGANSDKEDEDHENENKYVARARGRSINHKKSFRRPGRHTNASVFKQVQSDIRKVYLSLLCIYSVNILVSLY